LSNAIDSSSKNYTKEIKKIWKNQLNNTQAAWNLTVNWIEDVYEKTNMTINK